MTILDAVELLHRARERVARAKRNRNIHDDIEIMDGLVCLVDRLQESLRESATRAVSG